MTRFAPIQVKSKWFLPEVEEDGGEDDDVGLETKIPEDDDVVGVFRRSWPNRFIPFDMKLAEK